MAKIFTMAISSPCYLLLFLCLSFVAFSHADSKAIDPNLPNNDTLPGFLRSLKTGTWNELGSYIKNVQNIMDGRSISYSLASSGDGRTIAVGSRVNIDKDFSVGVYEYIESTSEWKRKGDLIVSDDLDFGFDVALSYFGDVLVVSAPRAFGDTGLVSVYRFDNYQDTQWEKIGESIIGKNFDEKFGHSIAVSKQANMIAIGAPRTLAGGPGVVRVYRYSSINPLQTFVQVGDDIVGQEDSDSFGTSVDILQEGDDFYLAIGAPLADVERGYVNVYIFRKEADDWEDLGFENVEGDEIGALLGEAVSLAHDGSTLYLAIGFPSILSTQEKSGAMVYSITTPVGEWNYYSQIIYGEEGYDGTGLNVALSEDGQTLAVGSPLYNKGKGMIRVFHKSENDKEYVQVGLSFVGSGVDEVGYSMSLSDDGKTLAYGSPSTHVKAYTLSYSGDPVKRSVISMVLLTFAILFLIGVFSLLGVKAVSLVRRPRATRTASSTATPASFSRLPTNLNGGSRGSNDFAMGNHQVIAAAQLSQYNPTATNESEESDGDSDISVEEEEDDIDYDTHLRQIT